MDYLALLFAIDC